MITLPDSLKRFAAAMQSRYVLKRELGRGGMAVVYLADDVKHHRQVAIKVFQPELAGTVGHERFLREIQVAANLTHPHILPLHDSGEAEGLLYYVMPYVQGETLRERLGRSGQLALHEAVRIAGEVADALGYAHRQGLVHRDIKPENVMLTSGHALVMDFGICRAVGEASSEEGLTRIGLTLGTPAYMSPEQWTAPERVGEQSDIYSLGCVLYEMLVGEPPFTGTTAAVMLARHTQQEMPSARVVRPDIPEAVEAVLRRALAKRPEARFGSAFEFGEALQSGITQPAIQIATPAPAPVAPGRRSPVAILRANAKTIAALLTLVAIAAAVMLRDGDTRPAPSDAAVGSTRVVVDLLENRTTDSTLNDLGRMAGDWITEGLHRTDDVDVVPSVSALEAAQFVRRETQARRARDPIRALAEETGAGIVITGAYDRDGDSIQFRLQITDVRGPTNQLIGAIEPVRGSPHSPSEAIREVRNRAMSALSIIFDERLALPNEAVNQPPDFEAYRAFSRGLDAYVRNANRAALTQFYKAFQLDSTFIVPLLYAAFCHSNLGELAKVDSLTQSIASRRDELTKYDGYWLEYLEARVHGDNQLALAAIRQAAALAPGSKAMYNRAYLANLTSRPREAAEALTALDPERGAMRGWFHYWEVLTDAQHRLGDHKRELESARRARRLYPQRSEPRLFELEALAAAGNAGDAERLIEELGSEVSVGLTPGQAMTATAVELRIHGHLKEARAMFDRALAWYRSRPASEATKREYLAAYAGTLHEAGELREAKQIALDLARTHPDVIGYRSWAGILAAGLGDLAEAQRTDQWLAGLARPYSFGFESYQRARIAALLNDPTRALELLRDAFRQGSAITRHPDLNFESLRDDSRLQELFRSRG